MKSSKLLVLLIFSSLLFQYLPTSHSPDDYSKIISDNNLRYNSEATLYEIEVYSQNDEEKISETLSWWPNDDKESTMMQFKITIYDVNILADLQNITFNVFTEYEEVVISLFSMNITPSLFSIENEDLVLITNYSYDSDLPGSNYSLELEVFFKDGTEEHYLDESQIILHKYGYKITSELLEGVVDFCQGYETTIPIELRNIGQTDTIVTINLSLLETFPIEQITYEFDQEPFVELFAGEMVTVEILIKAEEVEEDFPEQFDLRYNVEYYNESIDDYMPLDSNVITFESRLLPEYAAPGYILRHLEYGELINNTLNGKLDESIVEFYILQNNTMSFSLQLFNLGFNVEDLTIEILDETVNYQLLFDNSIYYNAQSLSEGNLKINRGESIEIIFLLSGLQNTDSQELSLSVNSLRPSLSSMLQVSFAKQPFVNNDLILTSNSSTTILNLSNNDSADVSVDVSEYSDLLTFENKWTISCDIETLIEVTLHPLEQRCDNSNGQQQISINTSMDLRFHFNYDQSLPGGNYSFNFTINHNPTLQTSNLSHSIMFQLFLPIIEDNQNNTDSNQNNTNGNQNNDNQTSGNNSSSNNNTSGTPVDDCADIQCDACPLGMVIDPNGGCCACMEAPENNVDPDEQSEEQNDDSTKTATEENSMPTYLIIGLVIAALIAAVVIIRARKSSSTQQTVSNKITAELPMPALPLPGLPIPSEPVVMQQWTDDNGYSWRQMSDRTIMWWNGSDWIPYGKN